MLTVRPAGMRDVDYLAPRLREADIQEVAAAGHRTGRCALTDGLHGSEQCFSIVNSYDNAVAMFGLVKSGDPDVGIIWMLGSDDLTNYRTQFLRGSEAWIDAFHKQYPLLTNMVDARNTVHIRWLRWLGFKLIRKVEHEAYGYLPFYEFVRLKHV